MCPVTFRVARTLLAMLCLMLASAGTHAAEPDKVAPVQQSAQEATGGDGSVTFENDIQPLLTRFGCNAGACHGKSRGQNGFALSLLGFDSDFDRASIVTDARGRRISPASPEWSLLLQKATAQIPHGGGVRFAVGSVPYEKLRRWIASGAGQTPADAPQLVRVSLEPASISLAPHEESNLRVLAEYSDGSLRDVTDSTAFQSNDQTTAMVSETGVLRAGSLPGETAVMSRYMNHISVCSVMIPLAAKPADEVFAALPQDQKLDQLVWEKLQRLGILPSETVDEATWHRRAFVRAIGRLPTPQETRSFLEDARPDKREQLIDGLLARPEYADFWANKWADLIRPNPYRVGMKAVWSLDAWLRESFRDNKPYDQFVRELVTAKGSTWNNGATVIYRDRPSTVEIGASVSQLFLGVRLECAKCHHHPFEVWSQDDFFGFSAFFARVGHQGGLSPPISGAEELIYASSKGQLKHGRTGESVLPKTLTGEALEVPANADPRDALAAWMTASENPFFAKVMANRVWAELMGQGFVEPVDDLRATNPASNQPLLDYLADDFRMHGYDIKHLIRTIMRSHAFELSSVPNERNAADIKNFSRYYRQRLRAEILLDAINDVLDVQEDFEAMPPGSRATQLWTHRASSQFLDTFGRPDPNQDPPCERMLDSTTPQVLHMMNSPELNRKLSLDSARPAQLAAQDVADGQVVEETYLWIYARPPTGEELQKALAIFPAKDATKDDADYKQQRRLAVEDLFWALMNTPEFLFVM